MSVKPVTLPRWARTAVGVDATNITTPSSGESDLGFTNGQNPVSSGKTNWLFNWLYQWIAFLNDSPAFVPTTTNAVGLTATGNGTGNGVAGSGGATAGTGVLGSGGSGGGIGVSGTGATATTTGGKGGSFAGGAGITNGAGGAGATGVGGASAGVGVSGDGGSFTGGTSVSTGAHGAGVVAVAGGGATPARGAASLTPQVAPTVPVNGDIWVETVSNQVKARVAGLTQVLTPGATDTSLVSEGFESATFPPTAPFNAWTAPSSRFGADLAYARDTGTPLAGTASANRPVGQTASTNSSLGLSVFLPSPSRIAFVFSVTCNTNGDFLQFFIDGVQFASFTAGAANANKAGRFISDVLREGVHTFDWRYVRGVSAAAGSEQAKVDTVEVIPEISWFADDARVYWKDEFTFNNDPTGTSSTKTLGVGANYINQWEMQSPQAALGVVGWNGTFSGSASLTGGPMFGVMSFQSPGSVIGDQIQAHLMGISTDGGTNGPFSFAKRGYLEWRIGPSDLTNIKIEMGFDDYGATNAINQVAWVFDSSLGTTWRLRTVAASTVTDIDTGIVATSAFHRFGISYSDSPVNSFVFIYDGKSVPVGTGLMTTITNLPAPAVGSFFYPGFRIRSVTVANLRSLFIDWVRYMALR